MQSETENNCEQLLYRLRMTKEGGNAESRAFKQRMFKSMTMMTQANKRNSQIKMSIDAPKKLMSNLLVVALVIGSACLFPEVSAGSSSNSVLETDFKKLPRTSSRGFNDVVEGPNSNPPDLNYDDYDDEYSQEVEMDHNLDSSDRHYLDTKDWEEHSTDQAISEIAKCCAIGEALNAEGRCHVLEKDYKHDRTWYPHQMYIVESAKFVPVNLSTWNVVSARKILCEENESAEVISDMGEFVMLADGGLFLSHHHRHIDPLDFCFDQQIGKAAGRAIKACFTKEELGASAHSIRKCCPSTTIVKLGVNDKLACFKPENPTRIPGNWTVIHGPPSCQYGEYATEIDANETIKVENDGTLTISTIRAPYLNYCLDYFEDNVSENPKMKVLMCLGHDETKGPGGDPCQSSELIRMPTGVSVIYGTALLVSSVCLALAAIISLRLPELRSLHGKCQLSHLATLFCFFVLLAATHLGTEKIPAGLCTFFAVAIHFCALSSFLWLNLLCVNIYLTFRSLRPPLAARSGENRRLFFLCVYAWGIPAAFCLFLYTLDKRTGTLDPMPSYGKCKCGISSREAEFAYLFGPVGFLLLCNGILFCLTAQELLCGLWRLDNSDSIHFRRKSMGIVVAKLGIVMGMGWTLDVLSWSAGPSYPYLFYAADIFNSLQGLFIFIVLIWRKRVLEVLHIRKPSIIKDETLTVRPFLTHKNSTLSHTLTNGNDQDTSLISAQDA